MNKYIEGANLPVKTKDGEITKRIYFNNAATSLALKSVMRKVNTNVPMLTYTDAPSPLGKRNTIHYEEVRQMIINYIGGDEKKDDVIYVKNATEGINLLSDLFYQEDPDQIVITTAMEHMANYLPFVSRFKIAIVDVTKFGDLDLNDLENKLKKFKGKVKLVTVTAASNVTGITPPIYKIAKLAHKYGAKILIDAVQSIQHRPFSMKPYGDDDHLDFMVFSAHKCYTPFDGGALVGPKEFFEKYHPFVDGSGSTQFVSREKIILDDPPQRYEAGYPDIFGVMAMGKALNFLKKIGLDQIADYEKKLLVYAQSKLWEVPKIEMYAQNSCHINIPIISFNIEGIDFMEVGKYLGYNHGIEVGIGTVGADVYVQSLMEVNPQEAYEKYTQGKPVGVVRISLGMYNTVDEIDILVDALKELVQYVA